MKMPWYMKVVKAEKGFETIEFHWIWVLYVKVKYLLSKKFRAKINPD